ncbi:RNA polymerase sigma-70 factor [Pedobacter heparinus]|uniref:RNA polymerase sigma factor n=1 Tax=Pedobacter heparinus TaxID=984 RepID=UPI00292D03E6|nr:RNA polymerase sigma-70 factor [Pedobacter heparinus]
MATYSTYSDLELFDLLKSGSNNAFTEIYNRYSKLLYAHAYRRLLNEAEADDIVHDLFTALWFKRENLVLKTNLAGYLFTAVKNRIIDYVSHKKIESNYIKSLQNFIDKGDNNTDSSLREKQTELLIAKEIAALPPKMREIFELSRYENYSHKQIAAKLGITEKTVKSQINNALKILRPKLGYLIWLYLVILYYSKIFF